MCPVAPITTTRPTLARLQRPTRAGLHSQLNWRNSEAMSEQIHSSAIRPSATR